MSGPNSKPCRCGQIAEDGSHYDCVGPSGTTFVEAAKAECSAAAEDTFVRAICAALNGLPDRAAAIRVVKTVCRRQFGVEVPL